MGARDTTRQGAARRVDRNTAPPDVAGVALLSLSAGRGAVVGGGVSFPLLLAGVGLGWTMIILALRGALIAWAIRCDPTGDEVAIQPGVGSRAVACAV